jgi:hypothetical protein
VEKLQLKAKTFKDIEQIVKLFGKFLSEAAVEVRNEAKAGLMTLKQVMDSRDLDNLLKRCLSD